MDGAVVGGSREGQAYGLTARGEPLVLLGDNSSAKTTRLGDVFPNLMNDNIYIHKHSISCM